MQSEKRRKRPVITRPLAYPRKRYLLCKECGDIVWLTRQLESHFCKCGESEAILVHPTYLAVGYRGRAAIMEQEWLAGRPVFDAVALRKATEGVHQFTKGQTGFGMFYALERAHGRRKARTASGE